MKERPIQFSAPMVRALLDGRKGQTRRVMSRQLKNPGWTSYVYFPPHANYPDRPGVAIECGEDYPDDDSDKVYCPYGDPGDRLWVREAWRTTGDGGRVDDMPPRDLQPHQVWYEADGAAPDDECVGKYRPSMFMPRWASRTTLEVTGVRVDRLQDISEEDAISEGIEPYAIYGGKVASWKGSVDMAAAHDSPRDAYRDLWNAINGPDAWNTNPWVWVVEFKRIEA